MSNNDLRGFLLANKKPFEVVFNNDQNAVNKYLLGVYNTLQTNPDLTKCTPESIKDAAVTSAVLDVPLDARHYAYLVPYGNKAQFQLSYKGYVYIAKRDVDVDNVQSVLVYEGDEFSFDIGNNTISHIPNLDAPSYGSDAAIRFAYAVVRFKANTGRSPMFEVMTRKQVDAIKDTAKQGFIWKNHYGEMARKTVIKRLLKHAQLGDVAKYDEIDNAIENNKIINVTPDGEYLVDDKDTKIKDEILEAVEAAKTTQDIKAIQAKYSEAFMDFHVYNVKYSKEISKAIGEKDDALYYGEIVESLNNCEDAESLNAVYENHKKKIGTLKAKPRKEIEELHAELMQSLIDNSVPSY